MLTLNTGFNNEEKGQRFYDLNEWEERMMISCYTPTIIEYYEYDFFCNWISEEKMLVKRICDRNKRAKNDRMGNIFTTNLFALLSKVVFCSKFHQNWYLLTVEQLHSSYKSIEIIKVGQTWFAKYRIRLVQFYFRC